MSGEKSKREQKRPNPTEEKSMLTQPYSNALCKLINHWYRYGYETVCEELTGKRYPPARLPFTETDVDLPSPPYSNEVRGRLNHWYEVGVKEATKGLTGKVYSSIRVPFLIDGIPSEDIIKEVSEDAVRALEETGQMPKDPTARQERDQAQAELKALKLALCRYSLDQDGTLRTASAIEERAEKIFKEISK